MAEGALALFAAGLLRWGPVFVAGKRRGLALATSQFGFQFGDALFQVPAVGAFGTVGHDKYVGSFARLLERVFEKSFFRVILNTSQSLSTGSVKNRNFRRNNEMLRFAQHDTREAIPIFQTR